MHELKLLIMNLLKNAVIIFFCFCFVAGCKDNVNEPIIVSGEVINAYTNEPLAEVTVKILEDGDEVLTDADGIFQLTVEKSQIVIPGEVPLSITLSGYKPREVNAIYASMEQYKMTPDTGTNYYYSKPVQLSDGIQTGNLDDAGFDPEFIRNLMNKLYKKGFPEIHSVLIYRNGKLAVEEYFFGNNDTINFENNVIVDRTPEHIQWTRNGKHYIASANKALTSTLVGIALDSKGISIHEKIAPYLANYSEYFSDTSKASVEFEDCLNMTAGFKWDEWGSNDLKLLWKSADFADFVLSRAGLGVDSEWRYNSALPNLLLKSLEELTGSPVRTWADANFYHKLGITDYKWQSQPDGYPEGAARMYLRPRDMLKVGITYLDNGVWDNEQVVPKAYVKDCFTVKEKTSSGDYSNYFWHRNLAGIHYLSADGDGGNYINIFPDQNMVIVITQGNYLKWPYYVTQANNIMKDFIFPAIQ